MTHEKGASSETACGGSTDVDQKVHTKFKDFVQGYDLSLLPPNLALPSDPAGGSLAPATSFSEQDRSKLEQSLALLQTNRQAGEKIFLAITSTTATAVTSKGLLQKNLQAVLAKISELHEVFFFGTHKKNPVNSLLVSNLLREAGELVHSCPMSFFVCPAGRRGSLGAPGEHVHVPWSGVEAAVSGCEDLCIR